MGTGTELSNVLDEVVHQFTLAQAVRFAAPKTPNEFRCLANEQVVCAKQLLNYVDSLTWNGLNEKARSFCIQAAAACIQAAIDIGGAHK